MNYEGMFSEIEAMFEGFVCLDKHDISQTLHIDNWTGFTEAKTRGDSDHYKSIGARGYHGGRPKTRTPAELRAAKNRRQRLWKMRRRQAVILQKAQAA